MLEAGRDFLGLEDADHWEVQLQNAYVRGVLDAGQLVTDEESRSRIRETEAGLDIYPSSSEGRIVLAVARGLVRGALSHDEASDGIIKHYTWDMIREHDDASTCALNNLLYARLMNDQRVRHYAGTLTSR